MPRLLHHATWNWGYRAETESTDQDRGSRGADAYSMRTGILIRYEVSGAAQAPAHRGFWEAAPPDGVPSLADGNAPPHRMSRISLECEALSLLESGFPRVRLVIGPICLGSLPGTMKPSNVKVRANKRGTRHPLSASSSSKLRVAGVTCARRTAQRTCWPLVQRASGAATQRTASRAPAHLHIRCAPQGAAAWQRPCTSS